MSQNHPLCFILMPFGKKKDATGRLVDFDAVYQRLIAPAVIAAGLEPVRADEERSGGIIQKQTFERLMLCQYALADLTTAAAGVFYQLGVRHAVRPHTTVLVFAAGSGQIPFDVHQLQAVPYRLSAQGLPVHEGRARALLTERLSAAQNQGTDSPIYQLVENYPLLDHTKTDLFRENLRYAAEMKQQLAQARQTGGEAVREAEARLGNLAEADLGVIVDLFLSYRAVQWWNEMIGLVQRMPAVLRATVMVQEQLGFALSRAGRGQEAERVLRELISRRGPSSESYGILGRVLKDRWEAALNSGETASAREFLDRAVDAYLKGFESDWRDAYPGVNAVTLMELKEPPDPRRRGILPVVYYAVEQRIKSGAADFWDYATLLELAVLARNEAKGVQALGHSLARVRESWEPETTARNLRLIREARLRREAESPAWAEQAETELLKAAARGTARP